MKAERLFSKRSWVLKSLKSLVKVSESFPATAKWLLKCFAAALATILPCFVALWASAAAHKEPIIHDRETQNELENMFWARIGFCDKCI